MKDFCADESTKVFENRLMAAATLWGIVRDSDMEKIYSRELLEKYLEIKRSQKKNSKTDNKDKSDGSDDPVSTEKKE